MFAAEIAGTVRIVMQTKTASVEDAISRARDQTNFRTTPIYDDELQEAGRY
jgi:hypothetical protein